MLIVVTDKEATNYNVSVNYPAYKEPPSVTVADYRSDIIKQIFTSLINQRFQELAQKENPPFLYASASFNSYARGYEAFNGYASTGTGDITKGLNALIEETERVKKYGFTPSELERSKKNILNSYERSYNNRDKTESANFTQEYISYFLEKEPSPGIEKEYEYLKILLPGITLQEVNDVPKIFADEKNRFVYVTAPEPKANEKLPAGKDLLAIIETTEKADVKAYEEKQVADVLLSKDPIAGKV